MIIALCEFPLWKNTVNGSIQCFTNFIADKFKPDEVIWVVLSSLDLDLSHPHRANTKCLYPQKQTIYIENADSPNSIQQLINILSVDVNDKSQLVTCDLKAGMLGNNLRKVLPFSKWIHLCSLHLTKNIEVLINQGILAKNQESFYQFYNNEKLVAQYSDEYVTVSQSETEWIRSVHPTINVNCYYPHKGWWQDDIEIENIRKRVPNPFYIRKSFPDKLLLLYVGRFTYQKGVNMFFQVKIPDNVHLCIMSTTTFGDQNLINQFTIHSQTNPDQFTWLGPHYKDDKIDIMKQCDAVICPSLLEPFGLVGLETLLFTDTLLICSGVDGMKEYLVDGGHINCGTSVQTLQHAIDSFSVMTQHIKSEIIKKGKEYANNCLLTWGEK